MEITGLIYSNHERLIHFLKQNAFYTDMPKSRGGSFNNSAWNFFRSTPLVEESKLKLVKIIRILKLAGNAKGRIISEQKRNEIIARISALASKMGQIKN